MTDKERLGEVKSEPFANLEKLKVDILQEKICSGLEDFEQDSKRQWTSLRFEKPLLVKLLSLIKQAERVQELEEALEFYADEETYEPLEVQIGAVTKEGYKISKYKYEPIINTDKGKKAREALWRNPNEMR